jgi:hypothetical protein
MRPAEGGDSWPDKSDFEKMTHAQLLAMVESADASVPNGIGTSLMAAAQQIQQIADQLNGHIGQLDWNSNAGDSFKSWARQIVSATDDLSSYATVAASNMSGAGSTLGDVKGGIPPLPTSDIALVQKFHAQQAATSAVTSGTSKAAQDRAAAVQSKPGMISPQDASAAQSRIDAAHQEAIAQLEKLGSSYEGSTNAMNTATPPVFPPTPQALMPPKPPDGQMNSSTGLDLGGNSSGNSGSHLGGVSGSGSVGTGGSSRGHVNSVQGVSFSSSPKGSSGSSSTTRLDGVTPVPTSPGTPGTATGGGGTGSPARGTGSIPGLGTGLGVGYGSGRTGLPGSGAGEGITGGIRSVSGGGRGAYGGKAIGASEEENTSGTLGGIGGGSRSTGLGGSLSGGGYGSSSAGEVAVGSGESGTLSGAASGEGVLGESARSATGSEQQAATGSRGMMGGGFGGMHGGSRNKRRGQRADYLIEDEDTWLVGMNEANPPVIE